MRNFLSIIFFFTCASSYTQCTCNNATINLQLETARYYTVKQDFKKVDSIVNLLQQNKNFKNLEYQKAFFNIRQHRYNEAKEDFIEYLGKGGDVKLVLNNLKISPNFSTEDSLFFVKNEKSLFLTYLENYDYQLILKLKEWYALDQYFNIWKNDVLENKAEQQALRKRIFQRNLLELRDWVIQNDSQLPQFNEIGYFQKPIILIIMHHTRNDSVDEQNYEFFEKILREEICNRFTYSPSVYVHLIDNMQLVSEENFKQVYGHHINYKENQIYPLKFPDKVDSLRAEIGLLPLAMYAEMQNVSLPENYN